MPADSGGFRTRRQPKRTFRHSKMGAPPSGAQQAVGKPVAPAVLGEVTERGLRSVPSAWPVRALPTSSGFPTAQHRTRSHRSLQRRDLPFVSAAGGTLPSQQSGTVAALPGKAGISDGIDEENLARIGSMSLAEISDAQRELRDSLPPALATALLERGRQQRRQQCDASAQYVRAGGTMGAAAVDGTEQTQRAGTDDGSTCNLETAKLEWTQPLADEHTDELSEADQQLRFGFDGLVLAPGRDGTGPVATELYHHGDNPASPGYTLPEMFLLVRSTVPTQRVVGLQLLAAVVREACVSRNSTPSAVRTINTALDPKMRLMLLLRCALDDTHINVLREAITVIRVLMVEYRDLATRSLLDRQSERWRSSTAGHTRTDKVTGGESMSPLGAAQLTIGDQEQLCHRDLVAGFVQMGILPRFRYILEVVMLPQPCALDIIRILRRCSFHSGKIANEIVACPRLIGWCVAECKRRCTESQDDATWLVECLALLREVCSASDHAAAAIWKADGTESMLSNLIGDLDINKPGYAGVVCQALRVFRTLLSSTVSFRNSVASAFIAVLHRQRLSNYLEPRDCTDTRAEVCAELLGTIEICCCGPTNEMETSTHWHSAAPLVENAIRWLEKLRPSLDTDKMSPAVVTLAGSLFHFMASCMCVLHKKNNGCVSTNSEWLASHSAHELLNDCLIPLFLMTSVQSIIASAAGSHWAACSWINAAPPDSQSQLDRCCPRLSYEAHGDVSRLNAGVGALRCLYFCLELQGPQWVQSAALLTIIENLFTILPSAQSSWLVFNAGAELENIQCWRMPLLFRLFFCRVAFKVQLSATQSNRLIGLAMAALHAFGPGDEAAFIDFVSEIAMRQDALQALLASSIANGCCPTLQNVDVVEMRTNFLNVITPSQAASDKVKDDSNLRPRLPLRSPFFMLPSDLIDSSHDASAVVRATRTGLQLLLLLESAHCNCVCAVEHDQGQRNLADKWCFLCRTLMSSESVWLDESCGSLVDAVMDCLLKAEATAAMRLNLHKASASGLGKFGSVLECLEQLLRRYGEESFGDPRLGRCVALFLRSDQRHEIRQQVWRYCVDSGGVLLDQLCLPESSLDDQPVAAEDPDVEASQQSQLARLQMQALLTPAATAIARAQRKPPLYCIAVEGVARHICTHADEDDGDACERRQILSQLCECATPEVLRDFRATSELVGSDQWQICASEM